jgi:hypothetical protein
VLRRESEPGVEHVPDRIVQFHHGPFLNPEAGKRNLDLIISMNRPLGLRMEAAV